jgi:hypothetical protein
LKHRLLVMLKEDIVQNQHSSLTKKRCEKLNRKS